MTYGSLFEMSGIVPALVSPVDAEGNLDLKPIPELVRFLLKRDIGGLFICGSTGEAFFQTAAERKALTEIVLHEVAGRVPVFVHVASMNYREALDLARHARKAGAQGIASVTPFYYQYSLDEIVGYYKAIADAASLPLIVYSLCGVTQNLQLDRMVEGFLTIEQLYGIKFSHSDMFQLQRLRQLSPSWMRFYGGWDSLALAMFSMGAVGLIGSNYSSIPELWISLHRAFCCGDLGKARAVQERLTHYMKTLLPIPPIARTKGFLKLRGVNVGTARWPLSPLSAENEAALRGVLAEMRSDPLVAMVE